MFIQTDKPVYKPGDDILYRILVLDQDLLPFEVTSLKHQIFDGKGNFLPTIVEKPAKKKVKSLKPEKIPMFHKKKSSNDDEQEAETGGGDDKRKHLVEKGTGKISKGIYSYFHPVIDEPVFGNWSIKVTVNDEESFATTKFFEVKDYILPRYEVVIETAHDVQISDREIVLDICGNYTFGELVSGTLEVTASVYDPDYPKIIHRKISKTGVAEFHSIITYDIKNELKIRNSIKPYTVQFDVTFKETLTGQIAEKQAKVRVYKSNEYFIDFIRKAERFKPGFPYSFVVTVEKFDGTPISSQTSFLQLKIKYFKKAKRCKAVEENLLESELEYTREKKVKNGRVEFTLEDLDDVTGIVLAASYSDSTTVITINRHPGETDEYLEIKRKIDDEEEPEA